MTEKMKRLDVLVQDWLLRRIDEVAKEMGVKRSVAVRLLLLSGLGEWKFQKWQKERQPNGEEGR